MMFKPTVQGITRDHIERKQHKQTNEKQLKTTGQ